jgi:tRNA A37 methylthiotransferase MiaB
MKRPASGERNLERIQRWREMCPELVIRSTFIAGFPGETESEFQHLLDFMQRGAGSIVRAVLPTARFKAQRPTISTACCRSLCAKSAVRASWRWRSDFHPQAA